MNQLERQIKILDALENLLELAAAEIKNEDMVTTIQAAQADVIRYRSGVVDAATIEKLHELGG